MGEFYDGTKLLSLKDINGNIPEIYIVSGNRSAGKTTYFNRLMVNRFKKDKQKFMLVYRFGYELDDCADKFFKDIKGLFFPNDNMTSRLRMNGIYHELFLNDESCGYAIALNKADQYKKNSHLFSDVCSMLFDEFQSETNHYCTDEIKKFQSIHMSVARGQNKQVRYVPVYMLSNNVTLLNPYFTALGISSRIKKDTKFLKGDGFVLENNFNESASKQQSSSAFNRAFIDTKYLDYASQKVYLEDNASFVESPTGKNRYIATLKYEGKWYAIREYDDLGIIYCDNRADLSYPTKIAVSTDDHEINYVMLRRNNFFLNILRDYFTKGCFRFKNLECKDVVLKALSL